MNTLARMNWGRWIADCPVCPDARGLQIGETSIMCAAGHTSTVEWPPEDRVTAISASLAKRPHDKDRNWFPKGHPLAEAHGIEAGLTPAQLDAQTAAHDEAHEQAAAERRQLLALLESNGLTVGPDGAIHGRITP